MRKYNHTLAVAYGYMKRDGAPTTGAPSLYIVLSLSVLFSLCLTVLRVGLRDQGLQLRYPYNSGMCPL